MMSIQCKRCYWISCKEGHQDEICKDCLNELKILALERQLAEAREAFKQIKDLTYNDFDHDVIRVHGIACKQLKEQG